LRARAARRVEVAAVPACTICRHRSGDPRGRTPCAVPASACEPIHLGRRRAGSDGRGAGRPPVTVNGCFDLLHAGHARLFADARALGEALIAG
jgi:hypothetical protein